MQRPEQICITCNGAGWLRLDGYPVGHDLFGKNIPCPNCAPPQTVGVYGLQVKDEGLTWDAIKPLACESVVRGKKFATTTDKLAERIHRWIDEQPGTFAYLWGNFGNAKTLILKVATAEAIRAGRQARYITLADLLDNVKSAFDGENPSENALARFHFWRSVDFLAVDEMDKARLTDWAADRVFSLFNYRYEAAMSGTGVTLMAANEPPETISGALASRANDKRALLVRVMSKDARGEMEWEK